MLIMRCISLVSYTVLIKGQPGEVLKPHRGIRQGDLISLYLFLICNEGLSALLNEAENSQEIRGIGIAKEAPLINHLFFVDDNLLFCRANTKEWLKIQSLLGEYAAPSSQTLNFQKISIFFNSKHHKKSQKLDP